MENIGTRNILNQGLKLFVDFSNRKCYSPNIMNYSVWTTGSASITANSSLYGISGYTGNTYTGSDSENLRELQTDPFGFTQAVIWNARTLDGVTHSIQGVDSSDGDGGWNSSFWTLDNSKMYRFSMWGKRYPDTTYIEGLPVHVTNRSGSLYHGFLNYTSTGVTYSTTIGLSTYYGTNATANPYFHIASSPEELGGSDVWTLIVGHVWPYDTATGSLVPGSNISNQMLPLSYHHPDSGFWTRGSSRSPGSKIGNNSVNADWIWNPEATSFRHRAYLYYGATGGCTASFVYPRVDIVDGFEPSIDELLTGVEPVRNLVYPGKAYAKHHTNYSPQFNGCMIMQRTKFMGFSGTMSEAFTAYAASVWFRPDSTITSASSTQCIFRLGGVSGLTLTVGLADFGATITGETIALGGFGTTAVQNVPIEGGQWHNITISWETSSYAIYLNGVKQTTTNGTTLHQQLLTTDGYAVIGGRIEAGLADVGFDGRISSIMVWDRSLSATDITTLINIGREKIK
jgi:hypothetical protein